MLKQPLRVLGNRNNQKLAKENQLSPSRFHFLEPDYIRPVSEIPSNYKTRIIDKLKILYGEEEAINCFHELERIMKVYYAHKSQEMIDWEKNFKPSERFTETDVILITYGDLIRSPGESPLETLAALCDNYLKGVFNTLHILPFFPYSSDRGFAVTEFEEVDPNLGTWEDIANLKDNFCLMFDGVFNHVSSKSRWFQEFLNQNPDYLDFFTVFSTTEQISQDHLRLIIRPRTTDILTPFSTLNGKRWVWTTFSPDQIDLNYHNPKVLLKMVEILLTYIRRGADLIRLDAVTYLWEELGTSCVHLNQSHTTIRLFRDILDAVAPHVALITETNAPHEDNIRYFGNGCDEAQMVYNFALPPLVLLAFQTQNAAKLTQWATSLKKISETATYFNFLDCHDGIGVMAVKNILSKEEIEMMALRVLEHGGFISYRDNGDGTVSPYELNITWYSAINREDANESTDFQVKRYLASRAIGLVFMGVPGVYLHGLLGSKNDAEAVLKERETRSINRTTINKEDLLRVLDNKDTAIYKIFYQLVYMIQKRISEKAFHPNAPQRILNASDSLFTLMRSSIDGNHNILTITNVTDQQQYFEISNKELGVQTDLWYEILTGRPFPPEHDMLILNLEPYEVLWLKAN
ncbi:MAG: alpha-amylase family glycosyl hydrolase [bacterium]